MPIVMPRAPSNAKRIPFTELASGMFVANTNCDWNLHSSHRYQFQAAAEHCAGRREIGACAVYADTALGRERPGAPTLDDMQRSIAAETLAAMDGNMPTARFAPVRFGAAHLRMAEDAAARHFLRTLMSDLRRRCPVPIDQLGAPIAALADAVMASPAPHTAAGMCETEPDYLAEHALRVCTLLVGCCQTMQLDSATTREVAIGSLVHDIGMARVPRAIFDKAGRLDTTERAAVERHFEHAIDMFGATPWLSSIAFETLAQHHERLDGSGYPRGLKGGEISLFGQLAAIADTYAAITSQRASPQPLPPAEALRWLLARSPAHFDATLIEHLSRSIGVFPLRSLVRLKSDRLGIVIEQNPQNLLRPVVRVVYDAKRFSAVSPYDIDLAQSRHDAIQGIERAEQWGVDLGRHPFS